MRWQSKILFLLLFFPMVLVGILFSYMSMYELNEQNDTKQHINKVNKDKDSNKDDEYETTLWPEERKRLEEQRRLEQEALLNEQENTGSQYEEYSGNESYDEYDQQEEYSNEEREYEQYGENEPPQQYDQPEQYSPPRLEEIPTSEFQ